MSDDTTELLRRWAAGDEGALTDLSEAVYQELRRLAGALMRRERHDHTLQPTALANEAFLRLVRQDRVAWRNRQHFFAIAARIMRRVLIDHARHVQAAKRGGTQRDLSISAVDLSDGRDPIDLISLNDAMARLEAMDERSAHLVELRYFGGLSIDEASSVLGVSPTTAKRDWASAKAWLRRELRPD